MAKEFEPKPVTLQGGAVKLVPLSMEHAEPLHAVAGQEIIWRYMACGPLLTLDAMRRWIETALMNADARREVPFAIYHKEDGKFIGSTRYMDIQRPHRGLEIGWTWITTDYWQTVVNTECKYQLLKHAFDELGALRVQLKTDSRNNRSQTAIERIGAKKEGVLRNHHVLPDGYVRNTVMYSITDKEWNREVKSQLQLRLL